MPELKIDISVWCNNCGQGICHLSSINGTDLFVDPCEKCMEAAEKKAYQEGRDEGREELKEEYEYAKTEE